MLTSPFPKEFLNRLEYFLPSDKIEQIITALQSPRVLSIRINTLKTTKSAIEKLLIDNSIKFESLPWYDDALILHTTTDKITQLSEYIEGKFYIQGLSSMIPALVLDPQPGEKILDIAAAPGSKTTQLAALMKNEGELVANDISRARLFKLKANVQSQGVTNVKIVNLPGEKIWQELPGYFDKVLVDAPCSMEGRFQSSEPKSYKGWSPRKIKELSHRQKYLLWSSLSSVRIDGIVVYSTCTLSPEENEEVIDWVLKKNKGAVALESINIPGLPSEKGLMKFKEKEYSEQLTQTLRIFPQPFYEGFFIAKLRRLA